MKIKKLIWMLLPLGFIACSDDDSGKISEDQRFNLIETNLSFTNEAGTQSVDFIHTQGAVTAEVVSEDSEWCSVSVDNEKINITVQENILVKSRVAAIDVTNGDRVISLLVRQAQKYFTYVAAVKGVTATMGRGRVHLKWTSPEEDNFSHVILTYEKRGKLYKVEMEPGVTEYTVKELYMADGEYTFNLQAVDKDDVYGPIVSVKQKADRLIAMRFEKEVNPLYVPYHFKPSVTKSTVNFKVGSAEYEDHQIEVEFGVDSEALAAYNAEHGLNMKLLPESAYTLPQGFVYTSQSDYQDLSITIDYSMLEDYKEYGLPLYIKSVSQEEISEIMPVLVLRFIVDDFSGWYTVDRLDKCGEDASKYPADPKNRRRYIKRTGLNTWETGYLFSSYVNNESHVAGGANNRQYITLDPATKKIHIQQGNYATSDDRNIFNSETNELTIEYLYSAWAGWWTHERMYDRSFTK